MTIYKDIPQPSDQRSVSQNDLLNNNRYLLDVSTTPSAPTGILSVDHETSTNNTANPTDGYHKQVSMINESGDPATMTNAVNGQNADGILYNVADTWSPNPHSLLKYISTAQSGSATVSIAYPLNIIQAFGYFQLSSGALIGKGFNLGNATVTGSLGAGDITLTFTFTKGMSNSNYTILNNLNQAIDPGTNFYETIFTRVSGTTFRIRVVSNNGGGIAATQISVAVLGIF